MRVTVAQHKALAEATEFFYTACGQEVDPDWPKAMRDAFHKHQRTLDIAWQALGLDCPIGAHLDVFLCSICAQHYRFVEEGARRRPKQGQARYCSATCRTEGDRRTHLLSWHKNKHRWRPGRTTGDAVTL